MTSFAIVLKRLEEHYGSLDSLISKPMTVNALSSIDDSRFLAMMSKSIFQAGFSWKVIDTKWSQFEKVFLNFDIQILASFSEDQWKKVFLEQKIIRNPMKLKAVQKNLEFILQVRKVHKSFAYFIATWESSRQIELFIYLKEHGGQLGGITGQRFLQSMGKDIFMLTQDVLQGLALCHVDCVLNPTNKNDLVTIQNIFNQWHQETAFSYTELSQLLVLYTKISRPTSQERF